jgi:DNA invertase Pin-like site-specific DNA recombinase
METKRALAYLRVSTDEQISGVSLDAQQHRIRAYCEAQGYTLCGTYCDAGLSGKSMDRPQLQEALALLREKKADCLVVLKLDRLSRSTRDILDLADRCQKEGFTLVSLSENLDTSSAAGRFVLSVLGSIAQLEREQTAERTRQALRFLREHRRVGELRYGFALAEDGKTLVPIEAEQQNIRRIVALRAKGLSYAKIAELLSIICTTKQGKAKWSAKVVRTLWIAHHNAA